MRCTRRVGTGTGLATRFGAIALAITFVATACTGGGGDDEHSASSIPPVPESPTTGPFRVALSTGSAAQAEVAALAVVDGDQLGAEQINAVLRRLPTFEATAERVPFKRPVESLRRPRVGATIDRPFGVPSNATPPPTDDGPLSVLRHQPDGDVNIAPDLSVTFNQPMVPLGTLEQLDEADVPVVVTPTLEGRWRWIGTRTLRFEFAGDVDRLPMATEYTVEVPAGTTSQTGGQLAEAVRWTFRTPAPRVLSFAPEGVTVDTQPVFVATFDQQIDPESVLATIKLEADGDRHDVRLATAEEIEADERARQIVESALDGRWIAFRPTAQLPRDTRLRIAIGPETPSAEGPRTTESASVHRARTYPPLEVAKKSCGFMGCRPGNDFTIEFTNALDLDAFDSDTVSLEPSAGETIGVSGNVVYVRGATRANTTYKVRLPASLRDEFGQTLGDAESIEFRVGEASPALVGFSRQLITTDPMAERPSVSVTSVGHDNLKVDIYAVDPSDWPNYQSYIESWRGENLQSLPDWRRVSTTTIDVAGGGAELTESTIDLADALGSATGHLVVTVSPTRTFDRESSEYWDNRPTLAWVQVTSIGVDALATDDELVAWATDLRDGTPLEGVQLRLGTSDDTDATATTDSDGLARIGLRRARFLTATKGDDRAILLAENNYEWNKAFSFDTITAFLFSDRGLYRPGETVRVKGWFRELRLATDSALELLADRSATWIAHDEFGNELGKGEFDLGHVGSFDFGIDIPAGAALGSAWLNIDLEGNGTAQLEFQIQEFRRPEFEVVTRAESAGPHLLTKPVTVAALAQYFSGGTLPDAPVTWQVTTASTTYSPPNWSQFTFGEWHPWWIEDYGYGYGGDIQRVRFSGDIGIGPCCDPSEEDREATYTGRTDATGTHYLQLDFEGDKPDLPVTVSANAAVEDVNRQSFASNLEVLVHPATLYVGLRTERTFVRAGEQLDIDAIVTDIDGEVVEGRSFTITAARIVEKYENGEMTETEVDQQQCDVRSTEEPVSCSIDVDTGGQYKITAVVVDDAGGHNRSELTRWVSGAEAVPSRFVEHEQATVVPDKERYRPGDTAELLVISPFADAHGLLTVTHDATTTTETFTLDDGSAIVEVPVTDALVPGFDVQVDLAGTAPRLRDDGTTDPDLPPRPAFASASLSLTVEPVAQTLTVTAEARERVTEPGAHGTVDVSVTDSDGDAVRDADVAVVVVDEAVLSLIGYQLPDPVAAFYPSRSQYRFFDFLRNSLVLVNPQVFGGDAAPASTTAPADGDNLGRASQTNYDEARGDALSFSATTVAGLSSDAPGERGQDPIRVRTNFDALAIFAPNVRTDAAGNASVEFDLPDNLTRYRVMAVVASGADRFGAGESTLTARTPLQVRPSAPRFLNFGDRFEFPVVVQNLTDEAVEADVVLETDNLGSTPLIGQRVTVPANDRIEVRFPAEADDAGTARFRVSAVSGDLADTASGEFPVYTPVTTEAFATYGVIDNGAIAQPLLTPTGVVPQFGGLEIDTSSTALQALTDAVVYMDEYDFRSADAYAARIIALTSLRDVFAAFGGERVPTPAQVDTRITSDIAALVALQREDGSFGTWTPRDDPQPYSSVQATHALGLARAAGFTVDNSAYDRARAYIRDIESHFPSWWDTQSRHAVSAYALHVRERAGDRDPAKAEALYRSDAALPLDALAWLWPVVDDTAISNEIARTIANRAHDTPGAVTFTSGYDDGAHLVLASDRRTDGIVLDALISEQPDSDLIPKVVTGLIGNQVKGRWNNIQENGFILVALQRYFATFEGQTPSFVARAWLGDTYMAEHGYEGRTIERQHTLVPMSELDGDPDIVIAKDGAGRLYYRLGLRYAPADLTLDPRDEGFVVDRTYEAVNDPDDVYRDDTGTWHIKPGAMVRVKLTMVADSNRTNMVLVDPLPAGLEAVNPVLAASPRPPAETRADDEAGASRMVTWDGWTWFDHENLRDDRVEAYSAYLNGGTYEYTYVARATTLGVFVVPPTTASEIYAPEVFGRSGSDTVTIAP